MIYFDYLITYIIVKKIRIIIINYIIIHIIDVFSSVMFSSVMEILIWPQNWQYRNNICLI